MTDDDSASDKKSDDATKPPGPTDQGRTGGMATREGAPEIVEKHQGESAD